MIFTLGQKSQLHESDVHTFIGMFSDTTATFTIDYPPAQGHELYVCKLTKKKFKLTFKVRMLDIPNAASTPQWPNVRYI